MRLIEFYLIYSKGRAGEGSGLGGLSAELGELGEQEAGESRGGRTGRGEEGIIAKAG